MESIDLCFSINKSLYKFCILNGQESEINKNCCVRAMELEIIITIFIITINYSEHLS